MAVDHITDFPTPELALKLTADELTPALSPQQQWALICKWHDALETNMEAGGDLTKAWRMISPLYDLASDGGPLVGKELSTFVETPLEALAALTHFGQYPPPELLVVLSLCVNRYFEGGGKITLEEAFFGKPKSRAGNRASRNRLAIKKHRLEFFFIQYIKKGMTRIEAAEKISMMHDGKPDTDSILRMMRGKTQTLNDWEKE